MMSQMAEYISFVKELGKLKDVCRTAWTAQGKQESTAEHSWRLAVLAGIMLEEYPDLDPKKVLMMALLHDVGEIYEGDISAALCPDPEQKYQAEVSAAKQLFSMLPNELETHCMQLWQEYEEGQTQEARLVKALDKAETIIQHNQGKNPEEFDYEFNLKYGAALFAQDPLLQEMRCSLDADTLEQIREKGNNHVL